MKYTDEEIVAYAKRQIRHVDQQKGKRLILGFTGGAGTVGVFLLMSSLVEKTGEVGNGFFYDTNFFAGIAFGILVVLCLGIAVLGFLRMFSMFYGKEIEVYRMLVRLNERVLSRICG